MGGWAAMVMEACREGCKKRGSEAPELHCGTIAGNFANRPEPECVGDHTDSYPVRIWRCPLGGKANERGERSRD